MNFNQFIKNKLVICDIQPSYQHVFTFSMKDFCQFVENYADVVVLYNGPDLGMEDANVIARFYRKNGMKVDTIRRLRWFQKNYAWFRDLMDTQCFYRPQIVRIVRYMIENKKWDWRDLTDDDFKKLKIDKINTEKYALNIPDLAFRIRTMNGADICGGGLDECLEEVLILADALSIKFNKINEFCY